MDRPHEYSLMGKSEHHHDDCCLFLLGKSWFKPRFTSASYGAAGVGTWNWK